MITFEEKIRAAMSVWDVERSLVEQLAARAEQVAKHAYEQTMHVHHPFEEEMRDARPSLGEQGFTWFWLEDQAIPTAQVVDDEGEVVRTIS